MGGLFKRGERQRGRWENIKIPDTTPPPPPRPLTVAKVEEIPG